MTIIGLGHKARHGKDFVAGEMVKYAGTLGIEARKYGFASALKAYARVAFGMREKDARLLQVLGTDIFRKMDEGIWVRVLMDTIKEDQPELAIITDMRFQNEAGAILDGGGKVYKITRLTEEGGPWIAPDRPANHLSEIALDDYVNWTDRFSAKTGDLTALNTIARYIVESNFPTQVMKATMAHTHGGVQ